MISDVELFPVLVLSLDKMPVNEYPLSETLAPNTQEATDEANYKATQKNIAEQQSDVNNKSIRLPIPIYDAILPVQHTGSSTNTAKIIDNDNGKVRVTNRNNTVSVNFAIKSSLSQLSSISDILHAIADLSFLKSSSYSEFVGEQQYELSAKASFFGSTICIYNAFLTGIFRQTIEGTDKELITLNFEKTQVTDKPDSKKQIEKVDKAPSEEIADSSNDGLSTLSVNTQAANSNAGGASTGRLFFWYKLGTLDEALARPLPQYELESQVEFKGVTIAKNQTKDFEGNDRQCLSLIYNGYVIPLGLNNHNPYYVPNFIEGQAGLAAHVANGDLYIGLESLQ